jgi:hypothetical protein
MNFPDSSSSSDQSSKGRKAPEGGTLKGGRGDLDLSLKLAAAAAFAASGYCCHINANLSATSQKGLADVTDVDVIAIRHDIAFAPAVIATSCKSGESRSFSPAREVFYLRGVLNYLKAEDGIILFSRKPVAPHLKDLGRQLGILILSGAEVEDWIKHISNGLDDPGYFDEPEYSKYISAILHPSIRALSDYLRTDYWFFRDFRNLQNLIGHYKKVAAGIDGSAPWHQTIAIDAAIHFSLTILDLCREIRLLGLSGIEEKTATYLFGGVISFKARRDLYAKVQHLLSATGTLSSGGPQLPPLEPAYTKALAELVFKFIERPHASTLIPQVLQDNLWKQLGAKGRNTVEEKNTLAAEKFAQDLIDLLKLASGASWMPKII